MLTSWLLIFPQLWSGHRPHKVHAFLSKFLVKRIILRDVNWKAFRMDHKLTVIRALGKVF